MTDTEIAALADTFATLWNIEYTDKQDLTFLREKIRNGFDIDYLDDIQCDEAVETDKIFNENTIVKWTNTFDGPQKIDLKQNKYYPDVRRHFTPSVDFIISLELMSTNRSEFIFHVNDLNIPFKCNAKINFIDPIPLCLCPFSSFTLELLPDETLCVGCAVIHDIDFRRDLRKQLSLSKDTKWDIINPEDTYSPFTSFSLNCGSLIGYYSRHFCM
jgi:hypothetical protein